MLVTQRAGEEAFDVSVDPGDTAHRAAAGEDAPEVPVVVVRPGRQGDVGSADGGDLGGEAGTGQHRNLVRAAHRLSGDAEQRRQVTVHRRTGEHVAGHSQPWPNTSVCAHRRPAGPPAAVRGGRPGPADVLRDRQVGCRALR